MLAGGQGPRSTAIADAVAANAAAAMCVFDVASGRAEADEDLLSQLAPRVIEAREAIATGAAARLLDEWVTVSRELGGAGG